MQTAMPQKDSRKSSALVEKSAANNFLRTLPPKDAQRMLSAAARYGGGWKTATPFTADHVLSDEDYRNAAKIGLGLPCQNDLPVYCSCGEVLREDNAHYLSCQQLKRPAMSIRHDILVNLLAKRFKIG